MYSVRQRLYDAMLPDVEGTVARLTRASRLAQTLRPGARVAIAAGSRGISNIDRIIKVVAQSLKELGAAPFIVPAMGSHGGATAEGQLAVLESLGITERYAGCPIHSSMEVVELGTTESGLPVYLDRNAAMADGIVVINRVKKHTDFRSEIESGLMKMVCIGLGKKAQADLVHSYGAAGLRRYIPEVARFTIGKGLVSLGIAILENGYDQTASTVGLEPAQIEAGERRLLARNKRHYPRIPFDEIDLLIVDQMGKEISGTGVDTNVIGRFRIAGVIEPASPHIKMIVTRDLTDASHGNALGIGLADFITRRLADKINFGVTYTNTITSGFLERAKLPIVLENDRQAIETALSRLSPASRSRPRIVRIRDTAHLAEFQVSAALIDEARQRSGLELIDEGSPLAFDERGNLAR